MKIKKMIALAVSLILSGAAFADDNIAQKVVLNNGTVLYGYISKNPFSSKESVEFITEEATVVLDKSKDSVSVTDGSFRRLSSLSQKWIDWATENDAYKGEGDSKEIRLHSVYTKNESHSDVYLLSNGARIKYQEFGKHTYRFKWSDVAEMTVEKRGREVLSGLNYKYKTANEEIVGQYMGETMGTDAVYNVSTENGEHSIKKSEVISITCLRVNNNQDWFEQAEFLDVIYLKSRSEEIRGIIIQKNLEGKTLKEKSFRLQKADGSTVDVRFDDIKYVGSVPNNKKNILKDLILKDGEIQINRNVPVAVKCVKNESSAYVLDSIPSDIPVLKIGENGRTTKVTLEYRQSVDVKGMWRIAKITEDIKESGKKSKRVEKIEYLITAENADQNAIYAYTEGDRSRNNTVKAEYQINGTGIYAIIDSDCKNVYPFRITGKQIIIEKSRSVEVR